MDYQLHPYFFALLPIALGACTVHKDLLTEGMQTDTGVGPGTNASTAMTDDPTVTSTGTSVTSGVDITSTGDMEVTASGDTGAMTGGPEDTTEGPELPAMCMPAAGEGDSYIAAVISGSEPVDEDCTVVSADPVGDGVEVVLDCPAHAAANGGEQPRFTVLAGPVPKPVVGETLTVFFEAHVDGSDFDLPVRELLFLRRADHLLYAAMWGKSYNDPDDLSQLFAPLAMTTPMGECPFTKSDEWGGSTGSPLDGFECFFGAVAELHLAFAADPPLVLLEGNAGQVAAGPLSYAADVRRAQLSEGCVDNPMRRIVTLAVALQEP